MILTALLACCLASKPRFDATAGYFQQKGAYFPGYNRDSLTIPPRLRPRARTPYAEIGFAIPFSSLVSGVAELHLSRDSLRANDAYLLIEKSNFSFWVGRREFGFVRASLVLGDSIPFDGLGISFDSVRAPVLKRIRIEGFAARLHRMGDVERPYFSLLRIEADPSARLKFIATRAAAIGGAGNTVLHFSDLPRFLVGLGSGQHGETENQVASLETRYQISTALTLYHEWAIDDMGFQFIHNPGLRTGAIWQSRGTELMLERTSFGGHCCGNPPWYRHSALPWMEQLAPLGHPLGGHGSQWLLLARRDSMHASVFVRERNADNIYAPQLAGRSVGLSFEGERALGSSLSAVWALYYEDGRDWETSAFRFGARLRL